MVSDAAMSLRLEYGQSKVTVADLEGFLINVRKTRGLDRVKFKPKLVSLYDAYLVFVKKFRAVPWQPGDEFYKKDLKKEFEDSQAVMQLIGKELRVKLRFEPIEGAPARQLPVLGEDEARQKLQSVEKQAIAAIKAAAKFLGELDQMRPDQRTYGQNKDTANRHINGFRMLLEQFEAAQRTLPLEAGSARKQLSDLFGLLRDIAESVPGTVALRPMPAAA